MLLDPWLFMSLSARHIPSTIAILISHQAFSTLFSPSGFSEALFGNFWATFGPRVKENAEARVIPLLEGRVSQGKVCDERVNLPVGGVVVEVGAGSGMWADVFKKIGGVDVDADAKEGVKTRRRTKADADQGTISKIYGIEPNRQSYTALRQRVKDIGLADVYEVVPVGIEDITDETAWDGKIEKGSVDCIVGILCLCSIPDQEENIRHLYELLKPGGRWYVYEHVKATRGGIFMRVYQRESVPNTHRRLQTNRRRLCQHLLVILSGFVSHHASNRRDPEERRTMVQDRPGPACRPTLSLPGFTARHRGSH